MCVSCRLYWISVRTFSFAVWHARNYNDDCRSYTVGGQVTHVQMQTKHKSCWEKSINLIIIFIIKYLHCTSLNDRIYIEMELSCTCISHPAYHIYAIKKNTIFLLHLHLQSHPCMKCNLKWNQTHTQMTQIICSTSSLVTYH